MWVTGAYSAYDHPMSMIAFVRIRYYHTECKEAINGIFEDRTGKAANE